MKRARIINWTAWVLAALTLCALVCREWAENGCDWKSLLLAAMLYTTFTMGFGRVIDLLIQEHYND